MGAGAYHFAGACVGPRGAFFTGLCECLKCIVVVGVIATAIGDYMTEVTGAPEFLAPAWWLGSLALLTAANVVGGEASTNFQTLTTPFSSWEQSGEGQMLPDTHSMGTRFLTRPRGEVSCRCARSRCGCSWASRSCH
mmetsp:Transcript_81118/g.262803  ORF Transcript_81118/g.262803 Transcript_81118/m.262803 type:complete len:137 (+) Transcript_81118:345-755(+)